MSLQPYLVKNADQLSILTKYEDLGSITYEGRASSILALDSSPLWQIKRTVVSGATTTVQYANKGEATAVWDDRASLFPPILFFNNYSTLFDGVNDYINLGNVFNFEHSQQWSFSCWLKPDNFASIRYFYSKATTDANVYGYCFRLNTSGVIDLQMRAPGQLQFTAFTLPLIAGQWSHVTLTYNGGSNLNGWRVYVNGTLDPFTPPSAAFAASILSGQNAIIGARNTAFYFSGGIDEVSVWDKSLASTEVLQVYGSGQPLDVRGLSFADSLVSFYRMGDGDLNPVVADAHGANNGTMVNMGAPSFVADVP